MSEIVSNLLLFYIKANCHADTPQASPIVISRWEVCVNSCANLHHTSTERASHECVWNPTWLMVMCIPAFFLKSQIWDDWRRQKQNESENVLCDDGGHNLRLFDDDHLWQRGEYVRPSSPCDIFRLLYQSSKRRLNFEEKKSHPFCQQQEFGGAP